MLGLDRLHSRVFDRRITVLADLLAKLLPANAKVLDVGCGDGQLARLILGKRPDVHIQGLDVLVRPKVHIPVESFDGKTIPCKDGSFDVVMLVDVVHHAEDPIRLVQEVARVSGKFVLIKDHTKNGFLAGPTLRFMDWVGNARYGVALPYHYWTEQEWRKHIEEAGLSIDVWKNDLHLYPQPARLVFERHLHFIGRFRHRN